MPPSSTTGSIADTAPVAVMAYVFFFFDNSGAATTAFLLANAEQSQKATQGGAQAAADAQSDEQCDTDQGTDNDACDGTAREPSSFCHGLIVGHSGLEAHCCGRADGLGCSYTADGGRSSSHGAGSAHTSGGEATCSSSWGALTEGIIGAVVSRYTASTTALGFISTGVALDGVLGGNSTDPGSDDGGFGNGTSFDPCCGVYPIILTGGSSSLLRGGVADGPAFAVGSACFAGGAAELVVVAAGICAAFDDVSLLRDSGGLG